MFKRVPRQVYVIMWTKPLDARRIALVSMFAVISIVLDMVVTPGFSSGIWYGWVFIMSPISGIVLGPVDGFLTTLISVMVGHTVVFRESVYEFVFALGAPIGSAVAGMIFRGRKRKVLIYYVVLLAAYFMTPLARQLPIWGMWDVYVAFLALVALTVLGGVMSLDFTSSPRVAAVLAALIGLEADILFRIFVLIPAGGYSIFYGLTPDVLVMIWSVPAPLITPIKVAVSVFAAYLMTPPVLNILRESEFSAVMGHRESV